MTGSDEAGSQSKNDVRVYITLLLSHLITAVAALSTIVKRLHHKQMAHVLWQQHCLEVTPRSLHVGVVDETRRTYRHHGRQREAPRRIVTFRDATLRVATHRLSRWGSRRLARVLLGRSPQPPVALRHLAQPAEGLNRGDLTTRARASPAPSDPPVHAGGPSFGECESP
jgi:hypothetical protein